MANTGQGDFPLHSAWVTRQSLARGTTFGQSDEALNTLMADWFFEESSVTALPPDMLFLKSRWHPAYMQ